MFNYTSFGESQAQNARLSFTFTLSFFISAIIVIVFTRTGLVNAGDEYFYLFLYVLSFCILFFSLRKRYAINKIIEISDKYELEDPIKDVFFVKLGVFMVWPIGVFILAYLFINS